MHRVDVGMNLRDRIRACAALWKERGTDLRRESSVFNDLHMMGEATGMLNCAGVLERELAETEKADAPEKDAGQAVLAALKDLLEEFRAKDYPADVIVAGLMSTASLMAVVMLRTPRRAAVKNFFRIWDATTEKVLAEYLDSDLSEAIKDGAATRTETSPAAPTEASEPPA